MTVYTVDTSEALLERLESLQTRIIEGNVRLIILDSIAALARRVSEFNTFPCRYDGATFAHAVMGYDLRPFSFHNRQFVFLFMFNVQVRDIYWSHVVAFESAAAHAQTSWDQVAIILCWKVFGGVECR